MELKNFFVQDLAGNALPDAIARVYLANTTTLAGGLEDKDGNPQGNPIQASAIGQLAFAAPDGDYDLFIYSALRNYSMRVQFFDTAPSANETALAGLVGADNKGLYFTGFGSMATYDLTAFGLVLSGSANASAARTALELGSAALAALGVANGAASLDAGGKIPSSQLPPLAVNEVFTVVSQAAMLALTAERGDVAIRSDQSGKPYILSTDDPTTLGNWIPVDQALSTSLAALSALTPAADRLPYFNGTSTAALATFTAFGRSLIDDADATAGRATLGAAALGANSDITSLTGTATNNNAPAGSVGEYVSSNVPFGSAVALTSTVKADITSISLTAGDWDVSATVGILPAGSTTTSAITSAISTTSVTFPASPGAGGYMSAGFASAAGVGNVLPIGTTRLSLASTTTVYLVAQSTFAVSTSAAYGFIGARRAR